MSSKKKQTTKKNTKQTEAQRQKKEQHAQQRLAEYEAKKRRQKIFMTVGIVLFSVIMVGSMLLPQLSQIFTSNQQQEQQKQEQQNQDAETQQQDTSTIQGLDKTYSESVQKLEQQLQSDPNNMTYALSVANKYYEWAYKERTLASSDEEKQHVKDLFLKAKDAFGKYLELNKDSNTARINQIMCQYYADDKANALKELEAFTSQHADYAPGWADLGMMYQMDNRLDDAKKAYTRAAGADQNNAYGVKEYAEQNIQLIQQQQDAQNTQNQQSTTTNQNAAQAFGGAAGVSVNSAN